MDRCDSLHVNVCYKTIGHIISIYSMDIYDSLNVNVCGITIGHKINR